MSGEHVTRGTPLLRLMGHWCVLPFQTPTQPATTLSPQGYSVVMNLNKDENIPVFIPKI